MRLASGWRASRHGEQHLTSSRAKKPYKPRHPNSKPHAENPARESAHYGPTSMYVLLKVHELISAGFGKFAACGGGGGLVEILARRLDALAVACSWSYSVLHTDVSGNVLFVFCNSHCAVFPRSSAFVPVSSQVAVGLPQLLLRPREKPQVQ